MTFNLLQETGDALLQENAFNILLEDAFFVPTDYVLDENRIPALLAVSNVDGSTLYQGLANPIRHSLYVDDAETGSDVGGNPDPRNEDRKVAFFAVSSVDGVTPVAVYIDPITNKLLVQST